MTALELRSISKVYGRGAAEVQALRDVSLSVAAGEMVAVMGPSGSGKSSLLTIAGTLEEPTSGAVLPGDTSNLPGVIAKIEKAYGQRASSTTSRSRPARSAAPTCAPRTRRRPTPGCCSPSTPAITRPGPGRWRSRPGSRSFTACTSARPGMSPRDRGPGRPGLRRHRHRREPVQPARRVRPGRPRRARRGRPAHQCGPGTGLPRHLDGLRGRVAGRKCDSEERERLRARPQYSVLSPASIVLIVSVIGLAFIGLVATAAFTVMAQRRQRALGMLASLGATESDVRFVLIADGLIGGVVGAGLGAAAALGG